MYLIRPPCRRKTPKLQTPLSLCNQAQARESCHWAPSYPPTNQPEDLIKKAQHGQYWQYCLDLWPSQPYNRVKQSRAGRRLKTFDIICCKYKNSTFFIAFILWVQFLLPFEGLLFGIVPLTGSMQSRGQMGKVKGERGIEATNINSWTAEPSLCGTHLSP